MNIVLKAEKFATMKHGEIGQVRKYTGEPYINHPAEVVSIVKSVSHTDEMLAAAWLHDTVEDTITTFEEIEEEFGLTIMEFVKGLTDVSKPEDGNRAIRKAIDRRHMADQTPFVKTIKLADLISNSKSILEHDPQFAKVYIEEKRLLLPVLHEGNKILWITAYGIAYGKI